jgi:hypothetical protein
MKIHLAREALKAEQRKADRKMMSSEGATIEDSSTIKKTFSFTNT